MPNKKPPHNETLIGGRRTTASSLAQNQVGGNTAYDGYVPVKYLQDLHREAEGIEHGIVRLELHIRHGQLCRYVISREQSFIHGVNDGNRTPG